MKRTKEALSISWKELFQLGDNLEDITVDLYGRKIDPANQERTPTDLVTQFDEYIVVRVRHEMIHNPAFTHSPTLDLEIDDIIQQIRIKLWHVAQRQILHSPKAYINRMISTTLIDLLRSREPTLRLFLDEEGEPYEGLPLIDLSDGMDDPSYETTQETNYIELLSKVVSLIQTLPYQQCRAFICTLRDRIDDVILLEILFMRANWDIQTIQWPSDPIERLRLSASLPLAREKLRNTLSSPPSSSEQQKDKDTQKAESRTEPIENPQHKNMSARNQSLVDITQLEKISEPSRTAIRLRYIECLSYDQMADRLQIPEGTLRSQVSRGMKQLQSSHSQPRALSLQHNSADIEATLIHLHEPYRTVIKLHYLEHFTYSQIAQQLCYPLGTVKSLVSRANKLMRQYSPTSTPAATESMQHNTEQG